MKSTLILLSAFAFAAPALAQTTTETTTTTTETTTSPSAQLPSDPAPIPVDAKSWRDNSYGINAGLGVPRLGNFGLTYLSSNHTLSAELGGGYLDAKSGSTQLRASNVEAALRYHLWNDSFFVGAAIGDQKLKGESSGDVNGQQVAGTVDIKTTYVTPQIGWLWGGWDKGFFTQLNLGWQHPLNSRVDYTTTAANTATPEYQDFERDVRDAAKKIGEDGLPAVMIKIGWLW
ncbi:MAG: hypothetical protein KF767_02520 [Bdellovibrionaceae bacterium]|nr:hypothetical protein [Pseudobdellovibrionaceae bacterium]